MVFASFVVGLGEWSSGSWLWGPILSSALPAALGGALVLDDDQPSEDRSAPNSLAVKIQGGMFEQ